MIRSGIDVVLAFFFIVCFLLSVAFHESAHAVVASWLGDSTPIKAGRRTLNVRDHIDPVGLLLCVILSFQMVGGAVALGWGRPVDTDAWKLKGGPNAGQLVVALAGPICNLILALLSAASLKLFPNFFYDNPLLQRIPQLILVFSIVNFVMIMLNVLPFYPLDGYQVLYALLPTKQAVSYARWAKPYGMFIILAIFFLLPFLGQLAGGGGGFFLFNLPYAMLHWSVGLIGLICGQTDLFLSTLMSL